MKSGRPVSLSASGLGKYYGANRGLEQFECTVTDWQCLGILGRNGAGKTTLLKILAGLLEKDAGKLDVEVDGISHLTLGPSEAVFVAEEKVILPNLTGWQYMKLFESLNKALGVKTDQKLRERLVESFELERHLRKRFSQMSKGSKRKTELVAAISTDVPFLIADEFVEGLDLPSMLTLEGTIRSRTAELAQRFIISSHDVGFMAKICDHILIVDEGRCVDHVVVENEEDLRERATRHFVPSENESVSE